MLCPAIKVTWPVGVTIKELVGGPATVIVCKALKQVSFEYEFVTARFSRIVKKVMSAP